MALPWRLIVEHLVVYKRTPWHEYLYEIDLQTKY